jgi:hypothetical protein
VAIVCTKTEVSICLFYTKRSPKIFLIHITDSIKDMDPKALKKEFCGEGKRISQSVIRGLDRELKLAKMNGDRNLKKKIKLRYSASDLLCKLDSPNGFQTAVSFD